MYVFELNLIVDRKEFKGKFKSGILTFIRRNVRENIQVVGHRMIFRQF